MDWMNNPKIAIAIGIYLVVAKAIVGVRDALDRTPMEDNTWFERFATIVGKTIGYMAGIRPTAPKGATVPPSEMKDATGTTVK